MKLVAPGLLHKADIGTTRLNIHAITHLHQSFLELKELGVAFDGSQIIVQEILPAAAEQRSIRSKVLLRGFRGSSPVNTRTFATIAEKLEQLISAVDTIYTIELNPLIAKLASAANQAPGAIR